MENEIIKQTKIAMIDIDRVVAKSSLVQKLKVEHEKKKKEIENWLINIKKTVDKTESKDVKSKLIKRYEEEFEQKKVEITKSFQEKLKIVNDDVTSKIRKISQENGYDVVLSKSVVVFGCDDITELVEKNIN